MSRLGPYLAGLTAFEALALAGVVGPLLYLIQCFRTLELISLSGRDIPTLFGHAALGMPQVIAAFAYVLLGIGIARAMNALQQSGELLIIHSNRRLPALFGALALVTILTSSAVFYVSHVVAPLTQALNTQWQAELAGDVVAQALVPHRFTEVVPGLTVVIGGRRGNGNVTQFFADDRRDPESRRTYIAESALVVRDAEDNYVLQMADGAVQYHAGQGRFSEIRFNRYDLSVDLLIQPDKAIIVPPTLDLVRADLDSGVWRPGTTYYLMQRSADGIRVIGMALVVAALTAFVHGRRRGRRLPIELVVIFIGLLERGLASSAPAWLDYTRTFSGAVVLTAFGALLLAARFWGKALTRLFLRPAN